MNYNPVVSDPLYAPTQDERAEQAERWAEENGGDWRCEHENHAVPTFGRFLLEHTIYGQRMILCYEHMLDWCSDVSYGVWTVRVWP